MRGLGGSASLNPAELNGEETWRLSLTGIMTSTPQPPGCNSYSRFATIPKARSKQDRAWRRLLRAIAGRDDLANLVPGGRQTPEPTRAPLAGRGDQSSSTFCMEEKTTHRPLVGSVPAAAEEPRSAAQKEHLPRTCSILHMGSSCRILKSNL